MSSQSPSMPPAGSPGAVLEAARVARRAELAASAAQLQAAVEWAGMHEPIEGQTPVAAWWIAGRFVPLAGDGAPEIAEYAVAEFAAALGMSTAQGRALIGQALELCYRLPKLWAAMTDGAVAPWRARMVAEATLNLTPQAAGFVDRQVHAVAGRITRSALARLVVEARVRSGESVETETEHHSPDTRHLSVFDDQVSFNGTVQITGELDLADALDLDKALQATAEQLKLVGFSDSLDARRAAAIGELARTQLALTYQETEPPVGAGVVKQGRAVTLFVHLSQDALTGVGEVGRCENTRTPISPETIRSWCGTPHTHLTVTPVLDLGAHLRSDAYELPERLQAQIDQRDGGCVFPFCDRPAARCDHDHTIPHERGGTTCTCNTGPLCRHHHRCKTHTPWGLKQIEPGVFVWRSPHGYVFLRNHWGTLDVTPPNLTPIPACLAEADPDPPDG